VSAEGTLMLDAPDAWADIEFENDGRIHIAALVEELYILTKERGIVRIGDVINHAQRDFLHRCERQLNEHGRIRAIVLKARQIGMSTIIEAIIFVLSMIHDHLKSLVISHEKGSAEALLDMTRRYWDTYTFKDMHEEKYVSRSLLAWADNGCSIQIATAKNVAAGRSMTLHCVHASEVAFYENPSVLMTGLMQSVPERGLSAVFLESTANGIGNFFHSECVSAMKEISDYEFFFYPWHEHPEYTAAYLNERARGRYRLTQLDEEELALRAMGIDDDRLIWRRYAIANKCQNDVDKFHQEYPTTAHEAFVSTGRNVFALPDLLVHYQPKKGLRGRLVPRNGRVEFVEDRKGWLTLYSKPSSDLSWGVYLIGGDATHTVTGDNAVGQVINRRTKEQVAVYRRKIDPIQFGKDLQMLGRFYHDAVLAPEGGLGPGYATVGVIAGDAYPNLWRGHDVVAAKGTPSNILGWVTNQATKHMAINYLKRATTEPIVSMGGVRYGLIIHDETTLAEMRDFVTDERGTGYENGGESDHDDHVMALAIAMAVDAIDPPPPAYTVQADPHDRPIVEIRREGDRHIAPHPMALAGEESESEAPVVPWEDWGEARDAWEAR
jgi:hypothetical protein